MGLSSYLSGALLSASVGGPGVPFQTTYLAFLLAAPGPADTGDTLQEPTYVGYQRLLFPYDAWTLDSSGALLYSPQIHLPPYQSGPGAQITAWCTCDSPTGGNWGWSGVCTPQQIDGSDPAPVWQAGSIIINLAAGP